MEDQGIQDAAIFLMSIGEEEAAEVFKQRPNRSRTSVWTR